MSIFCFVCLGCYLNGQVVHDGREVTLSEDPCLKCSCSNKRLTCIKKACPILQCPPSKQIRAPGECCPRCSEKRIITAYPGNCILGKGFHADGKKFSPDHCSMCTCINGTSICRKNTCPVLECAPEFQRISASDCCPHCPLVAEVKSTCSFEGRNYHVRLYQIKKKNNMYFMMVFFFRIMKHGIWDHADRVDVILVK